ncbi:MAG: hypothetical protein EOP52_00755 [Sphingobacteriales bacterium]|nr:MAG: hypothetical protein EOP52_00755 [Sphingobacteriales bacterium]
MKNQPNQPTFPKAAFQALLYLVGERFPARVQKLKSRLYAGADINQELLAPVRMMVYGLLGERSYERYMDFERAALKGDSTAETAWVKMLSVCRLLLRKPDNQPAFCLN